MPACSGTQVCEGGECVELPSHCSDHVQSGDETGVDCGGSCNACAPSCSDHVQNGDETGVDCGGSCNACAPTCSDRVQNGDETGVDCGGSCNPCPATCTDGIQNANETDLDCGGGTCTACGNGEMCVLPRDCQTLVCGTDNLCATPPCQCQPATCTDGVQNQGESDIDCGGDACRSASPCADGASCAVPEDCQSGVCTGGVCQVPTCTDGVLNQGESDIDCGGDACRSSVPAYLCADGASCSSPADCQSGVCTGGVCQVPTCADGALNQNEEAIDCGGPCPACCTTGADCPSNVCGPSGVCDAPPCQCQTFCGDNVLEGTEACDGTDFGGDTCVAHGFAGGTLTCSADCTEILFTNCTGCGNGTIDPGEQCDGTTLGSATCTSLGYSGGTLACTVDCSYDTTACTAPTSCPTSCPDGATCSVDTGYLCECPIYQTACGTSPAVCTSLLTDPLNCGSCGNVCPAGTACSSGKCMTSCQPPLFMCDGACIDPLTDSQHCTTSTTDPCAVGTDCTLTSQVCSNGACVTPAASPNPLAKCVGGGAPIDLNLNTTTHPVPDALALTDDLAAVSFRWALCSCNDIILNQNLFTDGFDSTKGPYDPTCEGKPVTAGGVQCTQDGAQWNSTQCAADSNGDAIPSCVGQAGAGIGANGLYKNNQTTLDWGALWWASTTNTSLGTISVEQSIYSGANLPGSSAHGREDAHVAGDVTATGGITGTLYVGGTVSGSFSRGSTVSGPVSVTEPCDCQPENLVNVVGIIDAHACTGTGTGAAQCQGDALVNDNFAAGVSPDLFAGKGGRLDLECGNYYFSSIQSAADVTIVVHGNTAIYIGGNVSTSGSASLNFQLGDSATLDIFVKGGVCTNSTFQVGSPNYPARTRVYVAGGTLSSPTGGSGMTCSGANTPDRSMDLKTLNAAANFYSPWGKLATPQSVLIYGSLFTGSYDISQQTTIHFDTAVSTPTGGGGGGGGGGGCTSCRDCNNQACIGGVCGSCSTSADCCAPLVCMFGTCVLY